MGHDTVGTETTTRHRGRAFWNWVAAILALLGSLAVVVYAYARVMGTAACTSGACGGYGPGETMFGLILYGTPIVGALAVLVSFVTAKRRLGFVVPVVAWVVVIAAFAILTGTF